MIILKANNTSLLSGAKYSYLSANYASGSTSLALISATGFQAGDYILVGELGSETSEIAQVGSITSNTLTLIGATTTSFAHPESTKVTILPYNQVKFFWTSTATFDTLVPLATVNVQAESQSTSFTDGNHSSGFGWFVYYRSLTLGDSTSRFDISNPYGSSIRYTWDGTGTDPNIANRVFVGDQVVINGENFSAGNNGTYTVTKTGTNYFEVSNGSGVAENDKTIGTGSLVVNTTSAASNPIPYADFAPNSVREILDSFFSMLNNKEANLISQKDALRWLNEGYARAKNELNLVNNEYNVEAKVTITTSGGTQEYDIESDLGILDFGDIVSITTSGGIPVDNIPLSKALNYQYDTFAGSTTKYYLRGGKIGFLPVPATADTYYMYYKSKSTALSNLYQTVNFPDNNFYFLLDFLMYRACPKLGRTPQEAQAYITAYTAGLSLMKVTAVKQSDNLDSWEVKNTANV